MRHASAANAAVVKMKLKNADRRRYRDPCSRPTTSWSRSSSIAREVTYSASRPLYVFVGQRRFQRTSTRSRKDDLEGVLTFIENGMTDICEAVFYNDKVIGRLPTTIVRQTRLPSRPSAATPRARVMKTAPGQRRRAAVSRSAKSATRSRSIPAPASTSPRQGLILSGVREKSPAFPAFISACPPAARESSFRPTFRRTSILPRERWSRQTWWAAATSAGGFALWAWQVDVQFDLPGRAAGNL